MLRVEIDLLGESTDRLLLVLKAIKKELKQREKDNEWDDALLFRILNDGKSTVESINHEAIKKAKSRFEKY